jgi:hypothetical protein
MALGGVYEISALLAAPDRLEPTLSGVLALLSTFLDTRHGLIALLAPGGTSERVGGSDWDRASAMAFFQRLPERAIGQIVVIPDIARDSSFSNATVEEIRRPHGEEQFDACADAAICRRFRGPSGRRFRRRFRRPRAGCDYNRNYSPNSRQRSKNRLSDPAESDKSNATMRDRSGRRETASR